MKDMYLTWNPYREFEALRHNFFNSRDDIAPIRVDITDEGDMYQIKADLPGCKKEDIHLNIENDRLTLSAQRHSEYENEDKKGKYLHCERTYGEYRRVFDLGDVDADKIHAKFADGVLTLDLPKKVEQVPASRQLEIE
ncbi:MAG: Hsp20/alpha crystallin family protein [Clostridia bacterium]|nr:Hsp20/alpha crystallin family protein [Clostridia bacterium]